MSPAAGAHTSSSSSATLQPGVAAADYPRPSDTVPSTGTKVSAPSKTMHLARLRSTLGSYLGSYRLTVAAQAGGANGRLARGEAALLWFPHEGRRSSSRK
jgi:hypothetical protein